MKIKEPSLNHYFPKEIVEIDASIHSLIMKFNKAGYKTFACCSGLPEDHEGPEKGFTFYISFCELINDKFSNHARSKGFVWDLWRNTTWLGQGKSTTHDDIRSLFVDFHKMLDDDLKLYGRFGK